MPLTVWIAGGVALISTVIMVAGLWFDSLFEVPSASRASSLVQHLDSRSVLGVFAHPDDETLAAGVLTDAAWRDGVDVRTITLTRGERGYAEPHVSRREDLALIRESELRRYGFALGIDHQEIWDFPDGELGETSAIVDRLVERIREWRPDLEPDANLAIRVRAQPRILGWRLHASQHLDRTYPLPGWLLFDFWDKEHYRVIDQDATPR